ncbi:MAG: UpxY family transcription antiterminator [Gemmatimonadota bacterium]|nr:MAG: UpxY family transcription antiterminator [Gemmatimonadota bacterium]
MNRESTTTPRIKPNGGGPRWYALYTRARHEKQVDARLQQRGIEAYLPLIPRERQWHDRKKIVPLPLFPSYVFARVAGNALPPALSTPGVASVVRLNGEPAPISDEEIENVRRFAVAVTETGLEPQPTPLVDEGQSVRIVSGPLSGVEGLVVERRGRWRALVQVGVRAIGQGLKIELDVRSLKPIAGS